MGWTQEESEDGGVILGAEAEGLIHIAALGAQSSTTVEVLQLYLTDPQNCAERRRVWYLRRKLLGTMLERPPAAAE